MDYDMSLSYRHKIKYLRVHGYLQLPHDGAGDIATGSKFSDLW